MGSSPACTDRKSGHRHVVTARRCNYSAFNGYHRTPSEYSEVWCVDTRMVWRTKSAYVDQLPNVSPQDERDLGIRR